MNNISLKKQKVGILGTGEVGSTFIALIGDKHILFTKDIVKDNMHDEKLDVLHICIPYTDRFEGIVKEIMKKNKPELTIIESTVPIKTTENIYQQTKMAIVHSPVRGDHTTMVSDLKKFTKFIGSPELKFSKKAQEYYKTLGITAVILSSSRETEIGKLLDTTYYALCIAWHQEMERYCNEFGISFEEAVAKFNETYNEGYRKTKPHVLRPVLTSGFIGGHCLMPNITILKTLVKSDFLDIIEESNNKKKGGE